MWPKRSWMPTVELGAIGIAQYLHRECEPAFLKNLPVSDRLVESGRSRIWKPPELIGRFSDIYQCDQCHHRFEATDSEYVSHWVTTRAELARIARGSAPWWRLW